MHRRPSVVARLLFLASQQSRLVVLYIFLHTIRHRYASKPPTLALAQRFFLTTAHLRLTMGPAFEKTITRCGAKTTHTVLTAIRTLRLSRCDANQTGRRPWFRDTLNHIQLCGRSLRDFL